jgi:hypothetical protein
MMILSKSGTDLIKDLSQAVEKELSRMNNKWWKNAKDLEKITDLTKQLAPFKQLQYKKYSISMQVEASLKFLHQTLPILQRKTGWFGSWIRATSHANIRLFARQQGIFDGDLRDYAERIKNLPNNSSNTVFKELVPTVEPMKRHTYIFSDWSFAHWSADKRAIVSKHMLQLLTEGHSLYLWNGKQKQLIEITDKKILLEIINQDNLDDLWSDRIVPVRNNQLLIYAKTQQLDLDKVSLLDYRTCNALAQNEQLTQSVVANSAKFFTPDFSPSSLVKTELAILDIEIVNAGADEKLVAELQRIRAQIESQPIAPSKYRSGIDTKAAEVHSVSRKPIFKALDLLTITPSNRYYRNEVYTDLLINTEPTSPFEYFELDGMHDFSDLKAVSYTFHEQRISDFVIKTKKKSTDSSLFLGECPFTVTNDWQALPSLSRGENLLDFSVSGLKKDDFEIRYCEKNGLYFIRHIKPHAEKETISMQMLLEMPQGYTAIPTLNTLAPLPHHEEIHRLLMKYYKFSKDNGQLNQKVDSGSINNGVNYLAEARRLKVGSCRLRAIGFKEEMTRLFPEVPVVINVNSNHCFIEMKLDGQWQRYCLGGYRNIPTLTDTIKKSISDSSCSEKNSGLCFFAQEKTKATKEPHYKTAPSNKP